MFTNAEEVSNILMFIEEDLPLEMLKPVKVEQPAIEKKDKSKMEEEKRAIPLETLEELRQVVALFA